MYNFYPSLIYSQKGICLKIMKVHYMKKRSLHFVNITVLKVRAKYYPQMAFNILEKLLMKLQLNDVVKVNSKLLDLDPPDYC